MDEQSYHCQSGNPTDADLLRRCAAADGRALRLLFDRYQAPLAAYLYRVLGCREDAEEAVADVFVRVWRSAAGFMGDASIKNWLYRIALHVAIDLLRRRRRAPQSVVPFADLDAHLAAAAGDEPEQAFLDAYQHERDRHALQGALGRIGAEDRVLLGLLYFEGCSYETICALTGYSLATVKSRLYRARQRLQRRFVEIRDSDEALEPMDDACGRPAGG
jgi:RNA polymerase sigma-70 factor (ECF subfamily)